MEYLFNHPWELAVLLGFALAFVLDLGRRIAVRYQIEGLRKEKSRWPLRPQKPAHPGFWVSHGPSALVYRYLRDRIWEPLRGWVSSAELAFLLVLKGYGRKVGSFQITRGL